MSVTGIGYTIHNKARVALERALGNLRKRVMGVDWEWIRAGANNRAGFGTKAGSE